MVYLEYVGLCQSLLLSFLLAGKVNLVTIIMDIYGSLMWCIGKERNSRCFEDSECSMFDLKLFIF